MNAKALVTTDPNVVATATIKFMKDRTIKVTLNTCDGVNARMCDAVPGVLFKELNAMRTKKRLEDTVKQHKAAEAQKAKEEAERRKVEEKANAT